MYSEYSMWMKICGRLGKLVFVKKKRKKPSKDNIQISCVYFNKNCWFTLCKWNYKLATYIHAYI